MDTASKEREVEERLKKEQERLQRQLEDDKGRGPERKPRERYLARTRTHTHNDMAKFLKPFISSGHSYYGGTP